MKVHMVHDRRGAEVPENYLEKGLRACGHEVVTTQSSEVSQKMAEYFDMGAAEGVNPQTQNMVSVYNRCNKDVMIVEMAYFNRAEFRNNYKGCWQLSFNWLNWVPKNPVPTDRLYLFVDEIKEAQYGGEYILLCDQKYGDRSHGMTKEDMEAWVQRQYREIKEYTNLPVYLRPHPMNYRKGKRPSFICDGLLPHTVSTIEKAIEESIGVVTFNSNVGIEALVLGKPVVCDGSCHYQHLAMTEIINPQDWGVFPVKLREEYLAKLAYTQFTPKEIESGFGVNIMLKAKEIT